MRGPRTHARTHGKGLVEPGTSGGKGRDGWNYVCVVRACESFVVMHDDDGLLVLMSKITNWQITGVYSGDGGVAHWEINGYDMISMDGCMDGSTNGYMNVWI